MATHVRGIDQEWGLILVYIQAVGREADECPDEGHHGYCWWCWRWRSLVHGRSLECRTHGYRGRPLCEACAHRYLFGWGPPWYPNHEQRCQLLVRRLFERQADGTVYMLPEHVCDHVADFLAETWRP